MDAIRLSPLDNIVVIVRPLAAGAVLEVDGCTLRLDADVGLGHKVACRAIEAGEKIVKYGVPIGSATCGIAAGEHVHLHNMQSDYLPTYTLAADRLYGGRP